MKQAKVTGDYVALLSKNVESSLWWTLNSPSMVLLSFIRTHPQPHMGSNSSVPSQENSKRFPSVCLTTFPSNSPRT
jgi:hypothetical protein